MALSNAQGLLFAEISTEDIRVERPPVTSLKGWFGTQQVGQIKSLITNTVNEHKGVVTHTVGDSILSSFADAQAALSAALGIQRRVAKAQNPATGMIVKVRIGLAYGQVRVFAGKVSGDSVTAAGILLEKAQGNEILSDQALMDAVGSVKDTRFEACGLMEGVTAYRVVSLGAPVRASTEATVIRASTEATVPPAAGPSVAAPPPVPRPVASQSGGLTVNLRYSGSESSFTAVDGEVVMGRSDDVHITVPDIHVSRKHAKITWEAGAPFLVNLSQNGTSVRTAGGGREQTCMTKIALEGDGEIALCRQFSRVACVGQIISFSVAAR